LDALGERLPEIRNNLRATPHIADMFLRLGHFPLRKHGTDAAGKLNRQPPLRGNCVFPADTAETLSDAWEMDAQFDADK